METGFTYFFILDEKVRLCFTGVSEVQCNHHKKAEELINESHSLIYFAPPAFTFNGVSITTCTSNHLRTLHQLLTDQTHPAVTAAINEQQSTEHLCHDCGPHRDDRQSYAVCHSVIFLGGQS